MRFSDFAYISFDQDDEESVPLRFNVHLDYTDNSKIVVRLPLKSGGHYVVDKYGSDSSFSRIVDAAFAS